MCGTRIIPLLICLWAAAIGPVAGQPVPAEFGRATRLSGQGRALELSSVAPRGPGLGMVWEKPVDPIRAAADLRAMADLGVRAIRTNIWEDGPLFDLADTLGILVFQELPVRYATAPSLADSLAYILRHVDRIREGGRVYALGLAYAPDTFNPETCRLLGEMSAAAADSLHTYIVSEFEADESCPGSVDLIFLREDRSRTIPGTQSGEISFAVNSGRTMLETEGAEQTEYFANRLPDRLSSGVWTFIYRWADAPDPTAFAARPGRGNWGLHRDDGSSRPALAVVEGAARRSQRAFPRPVPLPPASPANGYVLAGWTMVLALLLVYAQSPRFRSMSGRYFAAHGIYRRTVADNRDDLTVSNVTVLLCVSLLFGMVGERALRSYADHRAYAALWSWSGEGTRAVLNSLMESPVMLSLLIALLALLVVLLWMIVWYLLAARTSGGTFSQVMTLSIWPRWPVLATLPVVMLVAAGSWGDAAARLSVVWVLATGVWSTVRTNLDASRVLRLRPLGVTLLWLSAPIVPLLLAALLLAGRYADKLHYLGQLAR